MEIVFYMLFFAANLISCRETTSKRIEYKRGCLKSPKIRYSVPITIGIISESYHTDYQSL